MPPSGWFGWGKGRKPAGNRFRSLICSGLNFESWSHVVPLASLIRTPCCTALPPPDAIQEFRTEENAMSAEFGRGGAAVNVVLKAGTNGLHGGVYGFFRNDALDARNCFSATN